MRKIFCVSIFIFILNFSMTAYAQVCSPELATSFGLFLRRVEHTNDKSSSQLELTLKCLNSVASLADADKKEMEIKSKYKNINMNLDFKNAIEFRLNNRLLIDKSFITQISKTENLENKRSKIEALYNYYVAYNRCISEDLKNSNQPNRLNLNCPTHSNALQSAEVALENAKGSTPSLQPLRPALPLPSTKTLLACQVLQEVESERQKVSCNAQAYCKSYTKENSNPILKGTHLSSVAAEADHTRFNLSELEGCSGISYMPLCKSNFYRSPTSSRESPHFTLGNKKESLLERPLAVFTQGSCSPSQNSLLIPRIANEYGDGNVFYNTDSTKLSPEHCKINWDKYIDSYKKMLQNEFELPSGPLNCGEIPRRQQTPSRGSTRSSRGSR